MRKRNSSACFSQNVPEITLPDSYFSRIDPDRGIPRLHLRIPRTHRSWTDPDRRIPRLRKSLTDPDRRIPRVLRSLAEPYRRIPRCTGILSDPNRRIPCCTSEFHERNSLGGAHTGEFCRAFQNSAVQFRRDSLVPRPANAPGQTACAPREIKGLKPASPRRWRPTTKNRFRSHANLPPHIPRDLGLFGQSL